MPIALFTLILLLLLPPTSLADEGDLRFSSGARSIALPGQMAYMGKGLSFGLSAGVYNPSEDCDCMGSWQSQMEYFYLDWLSGGIEARFFGGDLDRDAMIVYQRYRLNSRVHFVSDDFDFFIEPFLGLENTDISEFKKQVSTKEVESDHWWWDRKEDSEMDSVVASGDCEKLFSLDGFSVGLGFGIGLNLSRYAGLTGDVQLEYNFAGDLMLNLTPGVAFNLQEVWPWSARTLRSTWLSVEVGAQRYFNRDVRKWSLAAFLGLQLGI